MVHRSYKYNVGTVGSENKHGLIQSLQFTVGVVLAEGNNQDTKTVKTFPLFTAWIPLEASSIEENFGQFILPYSTWPMVLVAKAV